MTKELEALKRIREYKGKDIIQTAWKDNSLDYDKVITINDMCDIIEPALNRLKEYDEIGVKFAILNDSREKQLKALEKIKNKPIDMYMFIHHHSCVEEYNDYHDCVYEDLTQEEYDILKEVLI